MSRRGTADGYRYSVQAFKARGKAIQPEPPREAADEGHCLRMAERLAPSRAGVLALRLSGIPQDGDNLDVAVIAIHGTVPEQFLPELPF